MAYYNWDASEGLKLVSFGSQWREVTLDDLAFSSAALKLVSIAKNRRDADLPDFIKIILNQAFSRENSTKILEGLESVVALRPINNELDSIRRILRPGGILNDSRTDLEKILMVIDKTREPFPRSAFYGWNERCKEGVTRTIDSIYSRAHEWLRQLDSDRDTGREVAKVVEFFPDLLHKRYVDEDYGDDDLLPICTNAFTGANRCNIRSVCFVPLLAWLEATHYRKPDDKVIETVLIYLIQSNRREVRVDEASLNVLQRLRKMNFFDWRHIERFMLVPRILCYHQNYVRVETGNNGDNDGDDGGDTDGDTHGVFVGNTTKYLATKRLKFLVDCDPRSLTRRYNGVTPLQLTVLRRAPKEVIFFLLQKGMEHFPSTLGFLFHFQIFVDISPYQLLHQRFDAQSVSSGINQVFNLVDFNEYKAFRALRYLISSNDVSKLDAIYCVLNRNPAAVLFLFKMVQDMWRRPIVEQLTQVEARSSTGDH